MRTGQQRVVGPTDPARHRATVERFGAGTGYSVLTPITNAGEVVGVLAGTMPREEEPGPELLAMLQLIAEQAAGAVARERLLAVAEEQPGWKARSRPPGRSP